MRRNIIVIVLLLAACSGDGTGAEQSVAETNSTVVEDDATTDANSAETDSTVLEEDTTTGTSSPDTNSTVVEDDATTSTLPPATTAAPSVDGFSTETGTPPDVFESFAADMTMTMGLGELVIDVTAEGIWAGDAFSCTVSSGLGGLAFSESIVATPEQLWVDSGDGYEPADLFAPGARDIMSSCPTSTLFWSSFTTEDFGNVSGETVTIAGRNAVRADLTELLKGLGGLGLLTGYEGAAINEMTVWVDEETNTVLAMVADMEMSDELMGEFGAEGSGPVSIVMQFELSRINDPSLAVELP